MLISTASLTSATALRRSELPLRRQRNEATGKQGSRSPLDRERQEVQGEPLRRVAAGETDGNGVAEGRRLTEDEQVQAAKPSREDVFRACAGATLGLSLAGAALRAAALPLARALPLLDVNSVAYLLRNPFALWHTGVVGGLVAAVTGGRVALLKLWPEYDAASNRSNELVLRHMSGADVVLLSFLPGFSEELFFNGALVPAFGATWQAVLASGAVFGVLHREGGRNWAFAAWATCVGWLYGASYLYTQDLLVPAFAHSFANLAAASLWLSRKRGQGTT